MKRVKFAMYAARLLLMIRKMHFYLKDPARNGFTATALEYPRRSLSNISSPFVCWLCSQELHHTIVSQLQAEIAALREEVVELHCDIKKADRPQRSKVVAQNAGQCEERWISRSTVARLSLRKLSRSRRRVAK